jgi:hypothetical protein
MDGARRKDAEAPRIASMSTSMDKAQVKAMRSILACEANGAGFPKLTQSVLSDLLHHKWIENVSNFGSHVYKSTQLGRQGVLAAGGERVHEYAFDVVMTATIRVRANSVAMARATLKEKLDAADSNFGAWDDGEPILGEASLHHIEDLREIDGKEAVMLDEKECTTCQGTGEHPTEEDGDCEDCNGTGYVATGYEGTP